MSLSLTVMILTMVGLLLIGAPVIFAIGSAGFVYFLITPGMWDMLSIYAHRFFTGMDSFVMLAIPLFVLAGEIMGKGGMTRDLVHLAKLLVGRLRGGMAYMNILASTMFAGVSGSALADISALGRLEIDAMEEDGYTREFAAALTATSAIQGPIIPPSVPMLIFASLTNASVGALFLAGAVPGVLLGVSQALVVYFLSRRMQLPKREEKVTFEEAVRTVKSALYALLMPLIILGGILGGFFTPTEAAAVAVAYSLIVTTFVYRTMNFQALRDTLVSTARVTASIYLIIGFVSVISWIMAFEQVPAMIRGLISTYHISPYMLLFLVNVFFLLNGMWLSDLAQLVLFAPLFTPIFAAMGIHPVHFGVVMVLNVMIGMITPPYGTALYMAAAVSGCRFRDIVRESLPFTLVSIAVLFLITYVPDIVLFLPRLLGFIQ